MSRVGIMPIEIPSGVDVKFSEDSRVLSATGPNGSEGVLVNGCVSCDISDGSVLLSVRDGSVKSNMLWGTCRSNVNNVLIGVSQGFSAFLDVQGVGFKAECQGKYLMLFLGFSHEIRYKVPDGVSIKCPKPNQIVITGPSKQRVFMVAGDICRIRRYNPYKGKGITLKGGVALKKEANKKK